MTAPQNVSTLFLYNGVTDGIYYELVSKLRVLLLV